MSNKKFKVTVKESKKSEAAESEFIQDFRAYMDTMDGEPYSEDDLIGWGWEWVSEKEEYPNGTKTCATTYTMTDNGARYKLVVRWNSFMETIVGYELTQEPANESNKSEGLPPKRLGSKRQYRSRADLINKMKQLGAVEITTSKQFNDIKNSQWLHTAGYALDTNGNLVAQSYYGDKDGKWYYISTRNFDSDYLPESKQHESKSDGERAVDDYDTLIDGLKELGFEPSSNVRNGKIYPYRTRFTATKDGIKYGFTLNEDRTGEYLESIEVVGGSIYTGDPNDKDARVFKSVGEVLDALKQVDGKKSEADEHIEFKQTEFPKELRKLYKACSERFYCEPYVSDMIESSRGGKLPKNEMTCDYTLRGSFGSDVTLSVNMVYRGGAGDLTFTVTVSALDETTGRSWKPVGDATASSFDAALNAAMSEVDKNLMPFAVKVRSAKKGESRKSESLSLKQKELKDMARYGEAEDITTISDAEAKELRKKGIETVGVSRGTYGMNGALLRDKDGKKYVITARSSNLFYFV